MRYVFGERDIEPLTPGRDVANPADPQADLASDIHDGKEWWDRALSLPGAAPTADQDDTENAWRQAYYVPGADDLVGVKEDADAEVPRTPSALCLSGGGIRSGCVAMGAMQTLSRAPEGEEPKPWDGAPRLDGFDYVISVSGGGYTAGARLMAIQNLDDGGVAEENGRKLTLADRFSPGSPEFAFLRRRSSYIADSPMGRAIKYPAAAGMGEHDTGMLIVAKAVLWQELPHWVLTYGAGKSGESFPNDKTSDQWFNEAQFAA